MRRFLSHTYWCAVGRRSGCRHELGMTKTAGALNQIAIVMPGLSRHPRFGRFGGMRNRQPCVYIMTSGFNGTLYTGVTSDLLARIVQHREGTLGGFSATHKTKRLVWFEMADTMEAAIAHEKRVKKWRREFKMNLIERDNPAWDDLAVGLGLPPLQ